MNGKPVLDPRLTERLSASAILTDTQIRLSFVPLNDAERVIAAHVNVRKAKIDAMTVGMRQGKVRIQLKEGFGSERELLLSPVEMFLITELCDRVLTEMPE